MKKTISGVLLALTAVFALVACGKKGDKTDTKQGGDDKKKGNINFYCWNEEFKTRLNTLYGEVEKADGKKTTLKDGITITWIQSPNQSAVYQNALDVALANDGVDMYCFEADYATKYVKSEYAVDMATLGIDQSKQYKYTKDIVTNASGKVVGSSWQATPGIIIYNKVVAEAVFGTSVTYEQMSAKLSTSKAEFDTTAAAVKAKGNGTDGKPLYYTMIGSDDWYRTYGNNLSAKMYYETDGTDDKGQAIKIGNIKVDKNIFQWAVDTKDYVDKQYIKSVADGWGLWGEDWGAEQGKDQCLTIFSCPWFTDFCLNGNRYNETGKDKDGNAIYEQKDYNIRAVKGYSNWFWGGTWLTATPKGVADAAIKDDIKDIIAKMTTDKTLLLNLAKKYSDFTNHEEAMTELGASDDGKSVYFGGQNVFAIYLDAVKNADLSKASDYDQQVTEKFQNAFRPYFQGSKNPSQCWAIFLKDCADATSIKQANITAADGVTISDTGITIA
jgi:hypothetical protein